MSKEIPQVDKLEEIRLLVGQIGAFAGDRLPIKAWKSHKAKINEAIDSLILDVIALTDYKDELHERLR